MQGRNLFWNNLSSTINHKIPFIYSSVWKEKEIKKKNTEQAQNLVRGEEA